MSWVSELAIPGARSMTRERPEDNRVVFFWILTLQWIDADYEVQTETWHGTAYLSRTMTRQAAYQRALAEARDKCGIPADRASTVLYFSLERNQLEAEAGR